MNVKSNDANSKSFGELSTDSGIFSDHSSKEGFVSVSKDGLGSMYNGVFMDSDVELGNWYKSEVICPPPGLNKLNTNYSKMNVMYNCQNQNNYYGQQYHNQMNKCMRFNNNNSNINIQSPPFIPTQQQFSHNCQGYDYGSGFQLRSFATGNNEKGL